MKRVAVRSAVRMPSPSTSRRIVTATVFASAAVFVLLASVAHGADMNSVNNAARIAPAVGAGTSVPSLGVGAVLQTVLGLIVVIGVVFGCAWLARRLGLQSMQRGGVVKTIGSASLGGKERVAVIEVGDTCLVLGVAPGNVRVLHTMPANSVSTGTDGTTVPSAPPGTAPLQGTFGQRFRDALKGEAGKRLGIRQGGEK